MISRCLGQNRDETPCSATPQPGKSYCLWHDPSLASERAAWRQRGGANRSNRERARKALRADAGDLAGVQSTLLAALRRVAAGELEPGPANALANLARAVVAVAGAADHEARLAAIERALADAGGTG